MFARDDDDDDDDDDDAGVLGRSISGSSASSSSEGVIRGRQLPDVVSSVIGEESGLRSRSYWPERRIKRCGQINRTGRTNHFSS